MLLTGCIGGRPIWKQNRSEKALENAKYQIEENRNKTDKKAIGFTYGADWSLSLDPEPSRYSVTAKSMTERSLLSSGMPDIQTALEFQKIVQGLVSSNFFIQKEAKTQLYKKELEVSRLQSQSEMLEIKLGKAEDKAKVVAEANASLANKWSRLMIWGKLIIGVVIFGFVLRLVAAVLPPPYSGIGGIIDITFGSIFKLITRAMPKVKEYANVVGKETFDVSEKTLTSLVGAIQQARDKHLDIKEKIDPILRDFTDKEISRPKITEIKESLGHV